MQEQPAVCFDGSNYLVAWMSWRGVAFDELDIWGARVTPGGVVLDPGGIPVCLEDGEQRDPSMAFDGSNYLVVWTDWRSEQYDIYGARMTPGGVILDSSGIPIRTTAVGQWWPRVAFDGSDFVVVWDEGKDIYGARISQQGVVVDTFVVAAQDGAQVWPALVHGRGSQVLVVYQGWAGVVGEKTYDTYHAWGKLLGVYGVEERTSPFGFGEVPATTVVRGVLRLPVSPFTIHSSLFDMSGRRVMPLFPGPNDVRGLAPGVYFVRSEPSAASREPLAVRKVVLTR